MQLRLGFGSQSQPNVGCINHCTQDVDYPFGGYSGKSKWVSLKRSKKNFVRVFIFSEIGIEVLLSILFLKCMKSICFYVIVSKSLPLPFIWQLKNQDLLLLLLLLKSSDHDCFWTFLFSTSIFRYFIWCTCFFLFFFHCSLVSNCVFKFLFKAV